MVADLHVIESLALRNLASNLSGAEHSALLRCAWALLLSVISLLLRRFAANSLLPGTIREGELDFAAHKQSVIRTIRKWPDLPPAVLRDWAATSGYATLLLAMNMSLDLLPAPCWPTVQKQSV